MAYPSLYGSPRLSSGKQTGMPPHFGFVSKLMRSSMAVVGAENNPKGDAVVIVDFDGVFYDRHAGTASRFSQGLCPQWSDNLEITCV
jgi:hypothetical protein